MSQGPPYCGVKAMGTVPEYDTNPYNLICLPVNGSDWNVRQVIIKCTFFAILTQGVSLFMDIDIVRTCCYHVDWFLNKDDSVIVSHQCDIV